jgi:hypothetical protein
MSTRICAASSPLTDQLVLELGALEGENPVGMHLKQAGVPLEGGHRKVEAIAGRGLVEFGRSAEDDAEEGRLLGA